MHVNFSCSLIAHTKLNPVRTGRKDVKTPEYGCDRKVGPRSFTLEHPAKCSNVRTGTVAGEIIILEDVRVDAAVYRQKKILARMACFSTSAKNMWWFHKAIRYTTVRGTRVPCGTL